MTSADTVKDSPDGTKRPEKKKADAIRSKLSSEIRERINNERFELSIVGPREVKEDLDARRREYAASTEEEVVDDVDFACFLAWSEMSLAVSSVLSTSDEPHALVIDDERCFSKSRGQDQWMPIAYFVSRVCQHAFLSWDLGEALCGAVHEALLDGSLCLDDNLRSAPDLTTRKVTVSFA